MTPRLFADTEQSLTDLCRQADLRNDILLAVITHIGWRWLHRERPPHTCGNPTAKTIPLTKKESAENAIIQKIIDDLAQQYITHPGVGDPDIPF